MGKKEKQRKTPVVETPPSVEGAAGDPVEGACRVGLLEHNIIVQEMNNDMKKDDEYNYRIKKEAERMLSRRDKHEECQESLQRSPEVDGETMKEMQKVRNKHHSETSMEDAVEEDLEGAVEEDLEGAVGEDLEGAVGQALEGAVGQALEDAVEEASEDLIFAIMLKRMLDVIEKREAEAKKRARSEQRKYRKSQRSREAHVETMNERKKERKYYSAIDVETPLYGLGALGNDTYLKSQLKSVCEYFGLLNNEAMKKPEPLPKEVAGETSTTPKIMRPYYVEKQKDESLGQCKKDPETLAPPRKDPELETMNADVKNLLQSLTEQHKCFVLRLYDYLFRCFGLEEDASCVTSASGEYYDDFVGQAVLSLCALYGDLWRIDFDEKEECPLYYFILHCAAMPIERDVFFFYNYLMRVAIIFQMALQCFDDDRDYFFVAKTCTYEFVDFLYFRDEGGWPALKAAAAVIAIATRPLRFVINCPKVNVGSFADVIGALEKFKSEGVINITKKEFSLLKAMDEKFKLLPHDGNGLEWKHLKAMLMDYFRNCMPKETTITLSTSDFHPGNFIIILDHFVHETDFYKKWREYFETPDEKIPGTLPQLPFSARHRAYLRFLWFGIQIVRAERKRKKKEYSTYCTLVMEKKFIPTSLYPIDIMEQSFRVWNLNTTKVPNSRRFVSFKKAYAEKLIELYQLVLPSFITNYCLQYLSPDSESKSSDSKRPTLVLIRESYYNQRKYELRFPDANTRMYGGIVINDDYLKGEIKTHSLRLVPMDVETLLDSYIRKHDAGQLLPEVEVRTFAVPEIREFESCTIWYVMGPLEDNSSLLKMLHAMKIILGSEFHERGKMGKANTDEMTVEKFRLKTRTGYRIPVPVRTKVPETPSESRPVGPETSSSKKKKQKKKSKKENK